MLLLPNGYFASKCDRGIIKVWDLVNYKCINSFDSTGIYPKLLLLKDNRIATISINSEIIIFDI
jgi:hypothetical protein